MQAMQSSSDVLAVRMEEAARRLGVSRSMMYRLAADGAVRTVKIGSSRRVLVSSLVEYLNRLVRAQDPVGAGEGAAAGAAEGVRR